MIEHDDAKLNEIAKAVTTAVYETGEQFGIALADLATVAVLVAGNINYAAHRFGAVEQLRNAADVFEQQLIADEGA